MLHTANVRLFADEIAYVVEHAGDEVLFVDASATGLLAPIRDRLPVRAFVVMEDDQRVDSAYADCPRYEDLLAAASPGSRRRTSTPTTDPTRRASPPTAAGAAATSAASSPTEPSRSSIA